MSSNEVIQSGATEQGISKPWYRHRWPWILMAGPAIVIVACIITIYLAFTQHRDTPLVNKQNRQGLMTTRGGDAIEQSSFKPPVDRPIPEHLREQFNSPKK